MKYYLISGEASGDLHGSNLMRGLYARDPQADVRFWGGGLMDAVYKEHQQGSGLVRDYREGAVMGIWEVFVQARKLLARVRSCEEDIAAWKPDVVVLIDYPGFNFRIAEFAHKAGFKVFWYIAPKVWASRERRIKKLKAYVDKLFIVFPFEIDYFRRKGVDFIYKGNPLVDAVDRSPALQEPRSGFLARHALPDKPFIALLAGSRSGEIKTMMPVLRDFVDRFHSVPQYADYQFVIAAAPGRKMEDYGSLADQVHVVSGDTYGVLRHAQAAVINSGTASLEAALIGTPQVVGYKIAWLTYLVGRIILKIKYISLANLVIDRPAFKELLQNYLTGDNLVVEVQRLLEDENCRARMAADYGEVREKLGGAGASDAVAEAMVAELKK